MNEKKVIAFYPYSEGKISYIGRMQSILSKDYMVLDYTDLKNGIYDINNISAIYLNWIENSIDNRDWNVLETAKLKGIPIVWVFHNRVPHDTCGLQSVILRLIEISDKICVLSKKSESILKEYRSELNEAKVVFLPLVNFIGCYGYLRNTDKEKMLDDADMVFSMFGLIRPYKNIEIAIEAFKVFNKGKKCKLLICGKVVNQAYLDVLRKKIITDDVIFVPEYIPSAFMGKYLEYSDVIVTPYNLESSMNSSAHIMAFSYGRTVITSDIPMANDYDEKLIYKYSYSNEKEHIEELCKRMELCYLDGREQLINKGALLKEQVEKDCSEAVIRKVFKSIFETCHDCKTEIDISIKSVIDARQLWKERYKIADAVVKYTRLRKNIGIILKDSNIHNVAIYGYGKYGKQIYEDLLDSGIKVDYIIDQKGDELRLGVDVYQINKKLPTTECLIITSSGVNFFYVLEIMRCINKNIQVLHIGDFF